MEYILYPWSPDRATKAYVRKDSYTADKGGELRRRLGTSPEQRPCHVRAAVKTQRPETLRQKVRESSTGRIYRPGRVLEETMDWGEDPRSTMEPEFTQLQLVEKEYEVHDPAMNCAHLISGLILEVPACVQIMPSAPCLQTLQRELADSLIRCASLDDIRILLACGAKVNEPVAQGLRPLHYATYQQYFEAVNLLLVRGSDPDAMDDIGYTALHLCAERGFLDLIHLLLDHGAKVSFTDVPDCRLGNPPRAVLADEPLRLAMKNGHLECAEVLLKHGANPNARYFLGSEINLISPLNVSFLELLLRFGADPDSRDRAGLTPLMKAARHPEGLPAVKLLVGYGADVNAATSERHDRRTVLHYAVLSGNLDTVYLLLKKGANVNFPSDYGKPTPLDFAVLRGHVELVNILISAGANVNAGSPIIGCPLHIALSEKVPNREELVKILLEAGADPNAVSVSQEQEPVGPNGPLLRPPLGEYFLSGEIPRSAVVRLLLHYGARVVLRPQLHHPLGILKTLQKLRVQDCADVLGLVLDAAETISAPAIKKSLLFSDEQREVLLRHAQTPITLKNALRVFLRRALGHRFIEKIPLLPLPTRLKRYLLHEL
ncbi:hypothetical protein LAZ67_1006781 [Cordylochernes scorpioides]|uniref:SOCS box domain-containing protein n=1 Tax=Cordylochernes scorpioides TaxID=51811 RepID=A0ABY6JZ49_9ARAC|nr:hypothetical protein LAZ67_1006781 [Cordylochernes scorpioides]